ncbi:MAG: ModD protein [Thermodesulfobacteriota bacterium]|nr:ModD protein [Thermodesulfobacteriota bacterium]
MIYFTENEIDRLLEDDVPLGDLTTFLMDMSGKRAQITLFARNPMVVCCTEEAARLYKKLDLQVAPFVFSGTQVKTGDKILEAQGDAASIHSIWRTSTALIEFASGISNRTNQLVTAARKENPGVTVAGTRKHPPYIKKVALKALMAGGGVPHRTGLSDTILIFREHLLFAGGYEKLSEIVSKIKQKQKERKIVVEAHSEQQAIFITEAGADAVQIDKMSPEEFAACAQKCKRRNPGISMIAAGGINNSNAGPYTKAGADILVSSWMYFAQPADIKAEIVQVV